MREDTFYKVLWVEDDLSIIESYQITAEAKDIELDVATNWEEAEKLTTEVYQHEVAMAVCDGILQYIRDE